MIAAAGVLLIGLLCLGYGYFIEPQRLIVRHETIDVNGWDPAFEGFRILMIGDVHGGSNGASAEQIQRVVSSANAENADLIVLLGDYVSENLDGSLKMPMAEVADNLSGLKARSGVVAVLGNHDGMYGDEEVAAEITRVGYPVLQNEALTVEQNGKRLRFLGLIDHKHASKWAQFYNGAKNAAAPGDGTGDLVILEHSPDIFPLVTGDHGISGDSKLFLAAHTHGGQVWLPILGRPVIPSAYGQKYAYGHVIHNGVDMWVTSGVGTSVLPFRFLVPPEITVLTIRRAA